MKRAACCFAALFVLASCQTKGPSARPLSLSDPRIASLLGGLAANGAARQTLRAQARLSLDAPDVRLRRPQRLVIARPTRLRVEVLGLFGQVAAVLVTTGGRYQFFDMAGGVVEEGDVAAELLWRLARVDLTPEEATDVLLGTPRVATGLEPIASSLLRDGGIAIVLAAEGSRTVRQHFEFDALGRVRFTQLFGPDGAALWTARFDDYRQLELGSEAFAFRVALVFPRVEAKAEIAFKQVELNPDLPGDVFVLSVPGGGR